MFKNHANISSEIYKFSQLQPIIDFSIKLREAHKGEFPKEEQKILNALECNLLQLAVSITKKRLEQITKR